jgi:MFS family permease
MLNSSKAGPFRGLLDKLVRNIQLDVLPEGPRRFLAFLFLNVLSWQCLIGTVLVLHARAIGIDRGTVGVLFSVLFFTGGLGVLTKPLAERYGSKRVLMTGWIARNLLVMPIVFTPVVLHYWGLKPAAILLFATISLFCITRSLAGIAWSSWLHEIVPPEQLGRFYTLETMMTRMLAVVFGVFAFFALGRNPPIWRFSAIAAVGVFFGLVSLRMLRRVPGGQPVPHRAAGLRGSYQLVFRDKMFMGFMACTTLYSFIYIGISLLVTLVLRDQLGLGAGTILLLTSFGNVLAIATAPRWRRVADRHGSPVVMAANGLLIVVCLVLLGFLRPAHAPVPLLIFICALIPIAESGNYVAVSRGYMLRMKPRLRHASNAVWSAGTQLLSGCSAVFMGYWLQAGKSEHFQSASWGYAGLMLAAIVIALRMPVPRTDAPRDASAVYDPVHPFLSLSRVVRYVLHPTRTAVSLESMQPIAENRQTR